MDGLRSLWQGGPFLQSPKFLFFPKQIVLGTDPVALDHVLIDMIEEKRKQEGAPSIFDRSPTTSNAGLNSIRNSTALFASPDTSNMRPRLDWAFSTRPTSKKR